MIFYHSGYDPGEPKVQNLNVVHYEFELGPSNNTLLYHLKTKPSQTKTKKTFFKEDDFICELISLTNAYSVFSASQKDKFLLLQIAVFYGFEDFAKKMMHV